MADVENIIERLERVVTWHRGSQRVFVQAIIDDLTGKTPPASAPPPPAAATPPPAPTLPGEGSGVSSTAPPAPPG